MTRAELDNYTHNCDCEKCGYGMEECHLQCTHIKCDDEESNMEINKWQIVPEANDDNDNPTCWSLKVGESKSKNQYIWICKYNEHEYIIEDSMGHSLNGKSYRTLRGAQRAAEKIGERQNESGCFTN